MAFRHINVGEIPVACVADKRFFQSYVIKNGFVMKSNEGSCARVLSIVMNIIVTCI